MKKAYDVEINSMHCVVFAETAPKARWMAVKGYRAAGYGTNGLWPRPVSHRLPKYDNNPLADRENGSCWSPDYVEDMRG